MVAVGSGGAVGDRIYIVVVASNENVHTTRNVGVTPDQAADTPITSDLTPVSSSRGVAIDGVAGTDQTGSLALESLAESGRATTLHAESLAAPLRTLGVSTESLARAVASGVAPLEWLTGVLVTRGVSIEAAGLLMPPALRYLLSPVLDGAAVDIGNGTPETRTIRIPAGEYATPFWLIPDEDNARAIQVDSLPRQTVLRAGSIRVQSTAP